MRRDVDDIECHVMLTLFGEMERKIKKEYYLKEEMWCERYWMSCYNDIIWGERERTLAISSAHSRCSVHCIIHSLHHCVHQCVNVCINVHCTLCALYYTQFASLCASMYQCVHQCAPHTLCSLYQCTVWVSIELCALMYALYTHWLHCKMCIYIHNLCIIYTLQTT